MTVMLRSAVLFASLMSTSDPVASTEVVMLPMRSGCKTTVTVKLALAPNAPRSQPTAEPLRWQLPCEDVTETKVTPSGRTCERKT
ncbi:hypothetical protein BHS07_02425 [Myxococcus xanthus]|uniref:Lipoprotein n=1 Tax=Myxococcus xanthus TaxID=34 RepID=A0AAE6FVF1_MYXXA|nr:hypothetical protein BHS09_02495 [Myxococcus xanthus]QDE73230.1 hypothetical protein BHS08_02495 [Myxococcus xanthus]QDE80502.1 hypothetical protein BHS07_02425 [Myxococcus xanthus]QDF02069.1 hypothetical protein BHS04_02450 [Myxococcus xanthus]